MWGFTISRSFLLRPSYLVPWAFRCNRQDRHDRDPALRSERYALKDTPDFTSLLTEGIFWNPCFLNVAHNRGPKFYKETSQEVRAQEAAKMDVKALFPALPTQPSNWERPGTWDSLVELGHSASAGQGQAPSQSNTVVPEDVCSSGPRITEEGGALPPVTTAGETAALSPLSWWNCRHVGSRERTVVTAPQCLIHQYGCWEREGSRGGPLIRS